MVTNYPHLTAHHEVAAEAGAVRHGDGVGARGVGRVVDRVRQVVCGLHGHDNLLQFERDRMFLRCVSCGHETPGWELAEMPKAAAVREESRPAMVRPHLVSARRIA